MIDGQGVDNARALYCMRCDVLGLAVSAKLPRRMGERLAIPASCYVENTTGSARPERTVRKIKAWAWALAHGSTPARAVRTLHVGESASNWLATSKLLAEVLQGVGIGKTFPRRPAASVGWWHEFRDIAGPRTTTYRRSGTFGECLPKSASSKGRMRSMVIAHTIFLARCNGGDSARWRIWL